MTRKKVAILLPWLKIGGTNKVALRFIRELQQYCDVTLILSQETGELFDEIPEGVRVLIDRMQTFRSMLTDDLRKFRLLFLAKDFTYYLKVKMGRDSIDNYRYIVLRNPQICDEQFDCAVSYHGQSPERLLNLLYRINSRKKVAWIHGEVNFSQDQCSRMRKYYQKLDHLIFVSGPTRDTFSRVFPIREEDTTIYYNPLDKEELCALADKAQEIPFPENCVKLLTVGRLSFEKGQDMIPEIVENLLKSGYKVSWYLIGDGDQHEKLEDIIHECHVEDQVKLLGSRKNPYCYMKNCDIYIQPSYTEGYSTTICEAATLGKAIIGTKPSGGIRDQITDGQDGMIVDATIEALTDAIKYLIDHPDKRKGFEREILKKDFSGTGEIYKFLRILE